MLFELALPRISQSCIHSSVNWGTKMCREFAECSTSGAAWSSEWAGCCSAASWGHGRLLRLWIFWRSRHPLRLCWASLLQRFLHRGHCWLHIWRRPVSLQSETHQNSLLLHKFHSIKSGIMLSGLMNINDTLGPICIYFEDLMKKWWIVSCGLQNCEIHAMAEASFISGSLTAQKRTSPQENTGFVFIGCKITGTGQVYLGRAWGAYSRTVYINTYMDNIVIPAGWQDWNDPQRQGYAYLLFANCLLPSTLLSLHFLEHQSWRYVPDDWEHWLSCLCGRTVYYGQYQCSGPGSNLANRVPWSHELSDGEASQFMQLSWIDGAKWLQQV